MGRIKVIRYHLVSPQIAILVIPADKLFHIIVSSKLIGAASESAFMFATVP